MLGIKFKRRVFNPKFKTNKMQISCNISEQLSKMAIAYRLVTLIWERRKCLSYAIKYDT